MYPGRSILVMSVRIPLTFAHFAAADDLRRLRALNGLLLLYDHRDEMRRRASVSYLFLPFIELKVKNVAT